MTESTINYETRHSHHEFDCSRPNAGRILELALEPSNAVQIKAVSAETNRLIDLGNEVIQDCRALVSMGAGNQVENVVTGEILLLDWSGPELPQLCMGSAAAHSFQRLRATFSRLMARKIALNHWKAALQAHVYGQRSDGIELFVDGGAAQI
jgi:hypothetical protein